MKYGKEFWELNGMMSMRILLLWGRFPAGSSISEPNKETISTGFPVEPNVSKCDDSSSFRFCRKRDKKQGCRIKGGKTVCKRARKNPTGCCDY